jgi:hypothetical protein
MEVQGPSVLYGEPEINSYFSEGHNLKNESTRAERAISQVEKINAEQGRPSWSPGSPESA